MRVATTVPSFFGCEGSGAEMGRALDSQPSRGGSSGEETCWVDGT